jgi:hypothetical protein
MNEVVKAEFASFSVFEPFLTNLIAADVEVPNVVGDVGEILLVVNPDLLLGFVVFDLFDKVRAIDEIFRRSLPSKKRSSDMYLTNT